MNTQRAITPKVEKPELRFMCSARRLMVFNVCVKFQYAGDIMTNYVIS